MVDQKYFFYDSLQRAKEKQKLMLDSEKTNKTSLKFYMSVHILALLVDKNGNLATAQPALWYDK